MWHSITLMSDMHTDDIVLPPVPPATLQRWCPALSFLINTRKTNKVAIHLKFQSINNPPMVSLASSTGQRHLLVYTLDIKRWKQHFPSQRKKHWIVRAFSIILSKGEYTNYLINVVHEYKSLETHGRGGSALQDLCSIGSVNMEWPPESLSAALNPASI